MCDMCPAILQGSSVEMINESPIAQWLERPTGIWKVMGSTPVGGSENSFSEYFDLRTLLHYLHFIQVTNPFIIFDFVVNTCFISI